MTTQHDGDFCCLNCIYSFRTLDELKSREKVCKNKDFCGILIPSEKDNILEFNQDKKLDTVLYIIYADIEFSIKKRMEVLTFQKNLQFQN